MNWKKAGKRMLFPPVWIIVVCVVISTVTLVNVFLSGDDTSLNAIIIYVFSAYSLVIFVTACFKIFPGYYRSVKEKLYGNKYANRYFTDKIFKMHVNLYRSLLINLIYVGINLVSAVIYHSNWFGIFAVYYAVMAILRFLLVYYVAKNPIGENRPGELKRSRGCAYILLTVNFILSGVVLMMLLYNRGFEYQGFLIYAMALYTFYITISAVIDMVKYRRYKSPVMTMSVIIKLTASLFSMLFLETAMFSQFGENTPTETKRMLIMATGAMICVVVLTISIYMIVHTSKEIKEMRSKNRDGK